MMEKDAVTGLPIHPGAVLKEELLKRGISQRKFCDLLQVPYTRMNEILNGKRPVTASFALMVQAAINLDPELLTTLQLRYNLTLASQKPALKKRLEEIRRSSALLAQEKKSKEKNSKLIIHNSELKGVGNDGTIDDEKRKEKKC